MKHQDGGRQDTAHDALGWNPGREGGREGGKERYKANGQNFSRAPRKASSIGHWALTFPRPPPSLLPSFPPFFPPSFPPSLLSSLPPSRPTKHADRPVDHGRCTG